MDRDTLKVLGILLLGVLSLVGGYFLYKAYTGSGETIIIKVLDKEVEVYYDDYGADYTYWIYTEEEEFQVPGGFNLLGKPPELYRKLIVGKIYEVEVFGWREIMHRDICLLYREVRRNG